MSETRVRSTFKSLIWRMCGIIILAIITYAYTRKWITTGLITVIHHGVFLVVFYVHERLWLRIKWIQNLMYRSLFKMFTYETVCGNIILGTITYLVTGDWRQMTSITLTYIGFKHICYIFNEFIWDRIKIGKISGIVLMILIALFMYSGIVSADYWVGNAIKINNFKLSTEIRMDSEVYYRHVQIDWQYKLNKSIVIAPVLREIYIPHKFEHNPMLDITYNRWILKNRSRMQLRMTDTDNIWRYRNKTTVNISQCFVAYEVFREKGEWFRNRYYIGINANNNLSIFFMCQDTGNERILALGINMEVGILK